MALHSFETRIKDGKIEVTAIAENTLKQNMSRQAKLLATGMNSVGKGVVIVGGGSGAFHAVESLREVRTQPQLSAYSFTDYVRKTLTIA
jgi:hypothetical protein